jgi:competence protein ComEA
MFRTLICFAMLSALAMAQDLPAGEGRDIVKEQCGSCHALKVVTAKKATKAEWARVVDQMISRGAEIEDQDVETVVRYLSKNFGPEATPPATSGESQPNGEAVKVNSASAAELAAALDIPETESASIVDYRQRNGNFKDWHDLAKVPGIGEKKIESNKDRLIF